MPVKNAISLKDCIANASNNVFVPTAEVSNRVGKYSFGIVNSPRNGKRLSFSVTLSEKLKLEKEAYLLISEDRSELFVSKNRMSDADIAVELNDDPKKLAYNAGAVLTLVAAFELDFTCHVSKSFGNIEIESLGNDVVAIIKIKNNMQANAVNEVHDNVEADTTDQEDEENEDGFVFDDYDEDEVE